MNPEIRESALFNFYRAERLSGSTPVEANERMGEYAKRIDGLQSEYDRDLEIIRQVIGRK